jgi:hypothetical protein
MACMKSLFVKYHIIQIVIMSNYKDTGEKSDESTSDVNANFSCETCGKRFNSRQELKEHTH